MGPRGLDFVVAPVRSDRTVLTKRAYVHVLYCIHTVPFIACKYLVSFDKRMRESDVVDKALHADL